MHQNAAAVAQRRARHEQEKIAEAQKKKQLRTEKAAATLQRKAKREQEELDAKKLRATQKAMRATKKRERDRENAPARKAATPGKKRRKHAPVFLASRPMTPEGEEKRKRGDTPAWAKREAREALIAVQFAAGAADPAAAFAPPKLTTDNAGALQHRAGALSPYLSLFSFLLR